MTKTQRVFLQKVLAVFTLGMMLLSTPGFALAVETVVEATDPAPSEEVVTESEEVVAEPQVTPTDDGVTEEVVEEEAPTESVVSEPVEGSTEGAEPEVVEEAQGEVLGESTPVVDEDLTTGQAETEEVVADDSSSSSNEPASTETTNTPVLSTDKDDYYPVEKVTIWGQLFESLTTIWLRITGFSGENGDSLHEDEVVTDETGSFTYEYQLDGVYRPDYLVEAFDSSSMESPISSVTFLDAQAAATLEQCHNGNGNNFADCRDLSANANTWGSGNAGQNNAKLAEGNSQNYRLILTDVIPDTPITITIGQQYTKGGKMAYDFPTGPGNLGTASTPVGLAGVFPCDSHDNKFPNEYCTHGSELLLPILPIPNGIIPDNTVGGLTQTAQNTFYGVDGSSTSPTRDSNNMYVYGATPISFNGYSFSGSAANVANGDSELRWNFTITPTSETVVIAWGAHISAAPDYESVNKGTAVTITGSPYHTILRGATFGNVGNQDMQMAADAVSGGGGSSIATLTVNKVVVNDNGGTLEISDFPLFIDGMSVTSGVASTTSVGAHTVSETNQPGYQAGTWGGDCNPDGTITLVENQNAVCTITNDDNPPSLTLNKIVVNNNGGTAQESAWTLTASGLTPISGPGAAGSADVVSGAGFSAGTYTLSESTGPDGYTASSWSCTNGVTVNQDNQITLGLGQTTVCSITNDDQPATLIVNKVVVNDNGGTLEADDFTFVVNGGNPVAFEADGSNSQSVSAGVYNVTEPSVTGYTTSYDNCSNLNIPNGGTATCTITNDDNAPSLTLVKQVINDNGGTAVPTDWTLTAAGYDAQSPDAGTYNLSESGPAGYTQTSLTCSNAQGQVTSVTLGLGEQVTCTFVNDDIAPTLKLVKVVTTDDGGDAVANDWDLTATGNGGFTEPTPDVANATARNVIAGASYVLSETDPDGYSASTWSCSNNDNDGTVNLALDEDVTCIITNDDVAPTLKLVKLVDNGDGGNAVANDWTLSATASAPNDGRNFNNAGGSGEFETIFANTGYDLDETGLTGYTEGSWSCDGGSLVGSTVTLDEGETGVTCTITNNDIAPKLTLVKTVVNNNGGNAQPNDFLLTIAGNQALSGTPYTLQANTPYAVNETLLPGYEFVSITGDAKCPDVLGGTVTLDEGDDITCTITNDDQQAYITVVKVVTNDNGGSAVPDDFDLTLEGNAVTSGVQVPVNPGTYTAGETQLSGYTFEGFTGDCDTNGDVTVALRESKTCTLTNNDQQAYIVVDKTVINDNGGTAQPNDFLLTVDDNAVSDEVAYPVNPGAHTVGETQLAGYTASDWGTDCSAEGNVTVALGQTKTCTITNDDVAPKLHLRKVVISDNGGEAEIADFTLTADGTDDNDLSGASPVDSDGTLKADTWTLSETNVPGYQASDWVCVGGTQNGSNITVGIGGEATCTITNDDIQPKLTVIKHVINDNGGTADAEDFSMLVNGTNTNPVGQFPGDEEGTLVLLDAGVYGVSESVVAGYSPSFGDDCAGSIGIGEEKICTVTNDDVPGKISGYKFEDVNANGVWDIGEPALSGWTINLSGGAVASDVTDGDGYYEFAGLSVGNYTVTETQQAGWTQTTSNPTPIAVTLASHAQNVNFGNFENGSVSGIKFNDLDGDGASQEVDEPELENWTIRLYDATNNPWVLVDTDTTDINGAYEFNNLAPGTYKVCEVLQNGWIETFASFPTANTSPSSSEEGPECQTINIDNSGESNTRNFGNYEIKDLTVSKTATPTYTRTWNWDITKTVDDGEVDLFTGDSQTVNYDVKVTKTGSTDSTWAVNGTITITNPNPVSTNLSANITDVSDVLTGAINANVVCPGGLPQVLAPQAVLNCTYSTALPDATNRTNTATVTTDNNVGGGSGNADVVFGDPTTVVDDEITVDDSVEGELGSTDETKTFEYSNEFSCVADNDGDEIDETGAGNYPNIATIVETGDDADADVTVNCYDLTVTKDATTTFNRDWDWTVNKVGDQTELTLSPGQTYPVNYEVTVNTTSEDSNWAVSGTITINNPAPIGATVTVEDVMTGDISATVNCPSDTVPAEGSLVCTYSSALPDASQRLNAATATLVGIGTQYSGTADVTFSNIPTVETDESIDLTDSEYGDLGVINAGDEDKTFNYTINVGPYAKEACGVPQNVDNTASFVTSDTGAEGSAEHNIVVNVECVCSLTQGYWKTHNDTFHGGAPTDEAWELIGDVDNDTSFEAEEETFYKSGQTWYQVFWTAPKGNVYYNMAHQYMASKINFLKGAWNPTIEQSLLDAEALLNQYSPTEIAKLKGKKANDLSKQFKDLASVFGAFNEGLTNPAGHCSEDSTSSN